MTFRQLAGSNIRGNWQRYMAFFLSSVFSVMIFFLFAQFIYHPGVVNGTIRGAAGVRRALVGCQYIIIIFSALFILYSNSAFLKSRKKEFGLFSLFGMTAGQLRRLVFYENLFISVLAVISGIGCGMMFSKLFFMAMTAIMDVNNPIPFQIIPRAVWITSLAFLLAFQLVTWISLLSIGRRPIVDLLKASKKPKSLPVARWYLTLAAVLCIGGGYTLAFRMRNDTLELMIPILLLVIAGTYFLFTQASVALLKRLQKTYSVYYKRTNLVTVSQLVFKMKDNARLLFMVSILSAVILTASGTFYILFQDAKDQMQERYPQTFGFVETGGGKHEVLAPERVKEILQEEGQTLKYEAAMDAIPLERTFKFTHIVPLRSVLVSESSLNALTGQLGSGLKMDVGPGEAVIITPFTGLKEPLMKPGDPVELTVDGKAIQLHMKNEIKGALINTIGSFEVLVVADDGDFGSMTGGIPPEGRLVYYGYELENWTKSESAIYKLLQSVPEDKRKMFDERVYSYIDYKQLNSLTLFIGLFVSFLFFISAGSMIYFKLFTELQEDQALFRSLSRIGVSVRELMKMITSQIAVIFMVPVLVGVIHAAFAFKALQSVMGANVWFYGSTVAGVFVLMQLVYFVVTRQTYMRIITRR
jgi:putative ABC transport system permease protein